MAALLATVVAAAPVVRGDDDDGTAPGRVIETDRGRAVRIDPALQRQSGIRVEQLPVAEVVGEIAIDGMVVDTQPLQEAHFRLREIRAECEVAVANAGRSASVLRRLLDVQAGGGDVPPRQLDEARSERDADAARVELCHARQDRVRGTLAGEWGETLASRVAADEGFVMPLTSGDAVILLLALPAGGRLPDPGERIDVSISGSRGDSLPSEVVAMARRGAGTQAVTVYARAAAPGLRTGMRVRAWVADGTGGRDGVRVPASAVVWYAGEAWVFQRVERDVFVRRRLAADERKAEGWFVAGTELARQEIVTAGAQMLLAEELRAQIPDEDDDP